METLQECSRCADEYVALHKYPKEKFNNTANGRGQRPFINKGVNYQNQQRYNGGWQDDKQSCTYCHKMGHVLKDCRFAKNNNNHNFNSSNSNRGHFNNSNNNARPVNVVTVENVQNNAGLCQIEFIKSTSYNEDK